MTRVSVVIATYGDVEWVHMAETRAYPSLERQTDPDFWFITRHEELGTRATSLNNAASETDGDWLIFLDADDELAPGYVDAMRSAIDTHRGYHYLFTPAVQQIRKGRPGQPVFFDRGISLRDDNWLVIGTAIHRNLFNRVGGFPDYPHGFEDWALWSKCYRVGAEVVKVPDAVYRYWHNPQSAHKRGWRDRKWQIATHQRVVRELDEWEAANT